jgi:hypothetical protein
MLKQTPVTQHKRSGEFSIGWHPFASYEKYSRKNVVGEKMASMFGMEWFEVLVVSIVIGGVALKDLIKMYLTAKKRRQMIALPPPPQHKQLTYR